MFDDRCSVCGGDPNIGHTQQCWEYQRKNTKIYNSMAEWRADRTPEKEELYRKIMSDKYGGDSAELLVNDSELTEITGKVRYMINTRITPENITALAENEIFIFGSNLSGIHGAGAAKMALQWGAVWGQYNGLQGQTYAIPTKSANITRTLTIAEIKPYVGEFIEFAKTNPDKIFLTIEIGCGLAGLTPDEVASLFLEASNVQNIHLPLRFWDVLNKIKNA